MLVKHIVEKVIFLFKVQRILLLLFLFHCLLVFLRSSSRKESCIPSLLYCLDLRLHFEESTEELSFLCLKVRVIHLDLPEVGLLKHFIKLFVVLAL